MIRHVCDAQFFNSRRVSKGSVRYNDCLIRQKYKIASIEITANDIMDILGVKTTFNYDLMVELNNSMSPFTCNCLYSEANITFNKTASA